MPLGASTVPLAQLPAKSWLSNIFNIFANLGLYVKLGIGIPLVFILIGTVLYYRDKINIGGSFDFLNAIPMSMLIVMGSATLIVAVLIAVFYNTSLLGSAWVSRIYWVLIPMLIYGVCFTATILNQQLAAGTIDAKGAASACVNPLMAGLAALVLGCSAYVRAPVISAFPVVNSVKVIDDVLSVEKTNPALQGMGIGYWLWWFIFISLTGAMGKAAINSSAS
jgi:hypothetical protein